MNEIFDLKTLAEDLAEAHANYSQFRLQSDLICQKQIDRCHSRIISPDFTSTLNQNRMETNSLIGFHSVIQLLST